MSSERIVSVERRIESPPEPIFDLLADPAMHYRFDGSDTVLEGLDSNPERLSLGSRFGMKMRLVVPYQITNEVVEFEENRLIAWRHFGHHIWRYRLEPDAGATVVTESFDWASSRFPPMYEWVGYPARHEVGMTETLERLAGILETEG